MQNIVGRFARTQNVKPVVLRSAQRTFTSPGPWALYFPTALDSCKPNEQGAPCAPVRAPPGKAGARHTACDVHLLQPAAPW